MFHGYGSNKSDLFSFSNFMDSDYLISIQAPIKLIIIHIVGGHYSMTII